MKLPKILHLYWGRNQPLSYLRYLTVISFLKYNPTWTVKVWTASAKPSKESPWKTGEQPGEYIGHDYLEDLYLYRHEINMESVGIPNDIPEVHKSDLLRWYLLGTQGGIWSDFDILYIAPLLNDIVKTWNGPGLCAYELPKGQIARYRFQAIGFLASAGKTGKEFFNQMFKKGIAKIPQTEYQAFGATLLEKEHLPAWEAEKKPVFYIDKALVYPYHSCHNVKVYFQPNELIHPGAVGLHWYAGHPDNGKAATSITAKNIREKAEEYSICREALRIL